ncbi:hypothetical protein BASA83_001535 [Batrachochytrium salamandrivorans]|nr:hypothetical protein BASA83_001535 [Batrachochytrium salamandrivorans]
MHSFSLLALAAIAATTSVVYADSDEQHQLYARNCLAEFIVKPEHHLYTRSEKIEFEYSGDRGPAFWAKLDPSYTTCAHGKHQSPIDFEDKSMLDTPSHKLSWRSTITNVTAANIGHTVQFNVPASSGFSLLAGGDYNGATNPYSLAQFHLHTPSEHHKERQFFDLEVHFVHVSSTKQLAVAGVWFRLSQTKSSEFLDSVLAGSGLPSTLGATKAIPRVNVGLLKNKFTAPGAKVWSYSGSLTTPPCTEGVSWSVLDEALPMSLAQFQKIQEVMRFNSRTTAPVGTPNFLDLDSLDESTEQETEHALSGGASSGGASSGGVPSGVSSAAYSSADTSPQAVLSSSVSHGYSTVLMLLVAAVSFMIQ